MQKWKLKQGSDRRIRAQHPWVFSNELAESPKGIIPGEPVSLVDNKGQFVAYGYGNPHSLIAFRALSFEAGDTQFHTLDNIVNKVIESWQKRIHCGHQYSFRLVYGESDWLPGLVIDRYVVQNDKTIKQIFACQILTAGMDYALKGKIEEFFKKITEKSFDLKYSEFNFQQTGLVIRNDVQIRKLEGLQVEEPNCIKAVDDIDISDAQILLKYNLNILESTVDQKPIAMNCDLLNGQKTGFFLDQSSNIKSLCQIITQVPKEKWPKTVRVLDLCCYVGQWSTYLARTFSNLGINVEFTTADISQSALSFANKNISRECTSNSNVICKEMDVLDGTAQLASHHYDIVIADPPAFIKAKKDIHNGKHAYMKLNAEAFRLAKSSGFVVSCSCSGLLTETEFIEVIAKSIRRQKQFARCVAKGGHSADHPHLMSFPEGFYLKMFINQLQ